MNKYNISRENQSPLLLDANSAWIIAIICGLFLPSIIF